MKPIIPLHLNANRANISHKHLKEISPLILIISQLCKKVLDCCSWAQFQNPSWILTDVAYMISVELILLYYKKPAALLIFHIILFCTVVLLCCHFLSEAFKSIRWQFKWHKSLQRSCPQTAKILTQFMICACKQLPEISALLSGVSLKYNCKTFACDNLMKICIMSWKVLKGILNKVFAYFLSPSGWTLKLQHNKSKGVITNLIPADKHVEETPPESLQPLQPHLKNIIIFCFS